MIDSPLFSICVVTRWLVLVSYVDHRTQEWDGIRWDHMARYTMRSKEGSCGINGYRKLSAHQTLEEDPEGKEDQWAKEDGTNGQYQRQMRLLIYVSVIDHDRKV